jgi:hypothetical protein
VKVVVIGGTSLIGSKLVNDLDEEAAALPVAA